jgi:hypothetical protein
VDPAAGADRARGAADDDVVAAHRIARGKVDERDLVSLRHLVDERQPRREGRARGQAAVVGDDRDVVAFVHRDVERRARRRRFGHGGLPVWLRGVVSRR